ncbi:acetyl/propionyl/methylcrotonyl-CoA carboxylase subunit alpha [Streptomyces sp. NPDC020965]|uniref:acetyl/propionyl/methylcrotonyl-CoA carboxylase subunit alpha n=1 Tax=Streptomyces sp. NPDC020965 TaxID=3365105 RepID=UPI0037B174CA
MVRTLLVANRGEIACRIFRTCRELGIATVAVYADADAPALHVREADAAVRLPGAAPADTYLRGDLIVKAALAAGADAVHPGYGFLSESAGFARAVLDAGLVWVGPPPTAIEAMASKTRAKELMGVAPLAEVTGAELPVLVKAAAGGGGRGMRIVRAPAELPAALAAARSEALAAFGDGEVFIEPYIEDGRHVEIQLLADGYGTVWPLGTRDCSLQRRHQKVIEESPAPGLAPEIVASLQESSVAVARAVGYIGAGTVEFLISPSGRAHFLEMNTRLQVEHPVTEAVFGLDLVAWQIRIAEGEALPSAPPAPRGHAVEARLYAEDPAHDWAPQTGVLWELTIPGETPGPTTARPAAPTTVRSTAPTTVRPSAPTVRVDTGYTHGDSIGVHYDAMIAKVVAWAPTRAQAVRRLADTLRRARVHGPGTNRELLVRSLEHPDFAEGRRLDTGFYERNLRELTRPAPGGEYAAVAAALAAAERASGATVPSRLGAWRNLPSQPQSRSYGAHAARGYGDQEARHEVQHEARHEVQHEARHEVRYHRTRDGYELADPPSVRVVRAGPDRVDLDIDGVVRPFHITDHGDGRVHVDTPTGSHTLTTHPRFAEPREHAEPGSLLAPMPGTVVRIGDGVTEGARVERGQPLLWLEAMKMEHRVVAPASGTLVALHAAPGHQVEVGALLAVVQADPERPSPGPGREAAGDEVAGREGPGREAAGDEAPAPEAADPDTLAR